ncbi:hypothetical protein QTI04_33380 [Variovorax sp. J22R115]|nr:hypothetical protein [Variovorax sp. J22R115]
MSDWAIIDNDGSLAHHCGYHKLQANWIPGCDPNLPSFDGPRDCGADIASTECLMRPIIRWLIDSQAAAPAPRDADALTTSQLIELIKFYEEASGKTKAHAWAQSTWVLAVNGAILGFSLKFFIEQMKMPGVIALIWGMAVAGLILSGYLTYVHKELGVHLSNYWECADRVARMSNPLTEIIRPDPSPNTPKKIPGFMKRLMWPPALFALSHAGWAIFATVYLYCVIGRTAS